MQSILLARVSSKEQEEGHSLVAQLNRLHAYCNRKNLTVIKEFVLVESSTRGERPEFQKLISYIKQQKQKVALVCDKVDRLQRSFREVPILEQLRKADRLVLHFVSENQILDSEANNSQIMAYQIFVMMAENYTNCISDNVKRSFEKKLSEGTILTYAPLGYINTKINDINTVIVDPDRGPKIKELFEKYSSGLYSLNDLAKYAKDIQLYSRKNKPLSATTIQMILHNPFYFGLMKIKNKLYPHIYPVIITKQLFDTCSFIAHSRHTLPVQCTKKHFLLSGMLRCKYCNKLYSPYLTKGKFVNFTPPKSQYCQHQRVSEALVMQSIEEQLQELHLDPQNKKQLLKAINNKKERDFNNRNKELANLNKELTLLQERKSNLLNLFLDQGIDRFEFEKLDTNFVNKINDIKYKISEFDDRLALFYDNLIDYVKIADSSLFLLKSPSFAKKRSLLKLISSDYFLDGKNVVFSSDYGIKTPLKTEGCQIWGG